MPASTVPVELNDDLRVTAATLTLEPVLVEWSQNWGTKKTDTYYAVTFSNATRSKLLLPRDGVERFHSS